MNLSYFFFALGIGIFIGSIREISDPPIMGFAVILVSLVFMGLDVFFYFKEKKEDAN